MPRVIEDQTPKDQVDRKKPLVLRMLVSFVSLTITAAFLLSASLLTFVALALEIGSRDISLNSRALAFYPENLVPIELLHDYAWLYGLIGVGLALFALPLVLALLEKMIVTRKSKQYSIAGER